MPQARFILLEGQLSACYYPDKFLFIHWFGQLDERLNRLERQRPEPPRRGQHLA